jgi:ABC-type branched-subunit amino acid transport system substrate-binding protein
MRRIALSASAVAVALVLAACGGGDDDETKDVAADDGVKTGPGISADTITLGVMTDLTGPFKDFATTLQAGHKIWADEINAKGGICNRQIKIETVDHGYKADQATIQFPDMEPKVAGFLELLGSPVIAALKTDINDRQVTTVAVSWSSDLLDQPYVMIVGTTYDIEQINGLAYLMEKGAIKKGDAIGAIYIDGEYGGNGLRGVKYFAEQHNMKLEAAKVTATDTDMKSIITSFKGKGVKAISLTTTPAQTASAASNNAGLGLKVPMMGNNPTFAPVLLDGPAKNALKELYVSASAVPYASNVPAAKTVAAEFKKIANGAKPFFTAQFGYATGVVWEQILKKACDSKDLSREGIHNALTSSKDISTDKLLPPLDYSKQGSPASRQVYIAQVDPNSEGGLKQVKPLFESKEAQSYKAPKES